MDCTAARELHALQGLHGSSSSALRAGRTASQHYELRALHCSITSSTKEQLHRTLNSKLQAAPLRGVAYCSKRLMRFNATTHTLRAAPQRSALFSCHASGTVAARAAHPAPLHHDLRFCSQRVRAAPL